MTDRNWTNAHCLAYEFIAFAGLTDGKITAEERDTIFDALSEWLPSDSAEHLNAVLMEAHGWVRADLAEGTIAHTINSIAQFLNDEPFKGNTTTKTNFLDDLVRISIADGNFQEAEKDWIRSTARIFGLNNYEV